MESVGQILRAERLRQGLALESVSAGTRIAVGKLSAIEADAVSQFSSAFFYKSFVRQFAGYLGFEFSAISAAVQQAADALPEPRLPGQDDGTMPKVAALVLPRVLSFRWLYSTASLIAVLVACSTLYSVWRASRTGLGFGLSRTIAEIRVGLSSPKKSSLLSEVAKQSDWKASSPSQVIAQNQPSAAAPGEEVFKLQVSAVEKTWLSIVSDGTRVYSGILQADESKLLEGHESARLKTGNAGGLEVVFNGKQIGPLGAKGQVRTVVFTRDNFEIVPPPVHIAWVMFPKPNAE